MNDNIIYLNEWMRYNESFRENLQIVGPDLVCRIKGNIESINISDYYLPNILYNTNLREALKNTNQLTAEDLFRIIRVNVLAEVLANPPSNSFHDLYITNMDLRNDEQGTPFISFTDNYGHKFKISQNLEQVLSMFQRLQEQDGQVRFSKLKMELERLKNETSENM